MRADTLRKWREESEVAGGKPGPAWAVLVIVAPEGGCGDFVLLKLKRAPESSCVKVTVVPRNKMPLTA
jgi:hypothetical protein